MQADRPDTKHLHDVRVWAWDEGGQPPELRATLDGHGALKAAEAVVEDVALDALRDRRATVQAKLDQLASEARDRRDARALLGAAINALTDHKRERTSFSRRLALDVVAAADAVLAALPDGGPEDWPPRARELLARAREELTDDAE